LDAATGTSSNPAVFSGSWLLSELARCRLRGLRYRHASEHLTLHEPSG
jgi:hypothetical protein